MSRSTPALTPWYPHDIKPVRAGVYQRDMANWPYPASEWSYWTGKFWSGWAHSKDMAEKNKGLRSACQDAPWRGLARKPRA